MPESSHGLHHSQKDPEPLGWSLTNEPYRTIGPGLWVDSLACQVSGFQHLFTNRLEHSRVSRFGQSCVTPTRKQSFYIRSHLGPQIPELSTRGPSSALEEIWPPVRDRKANPPVKEGMKGHGWGRRTLLSCRKRTVISIHIRQPCIDLAPRIQTPLVHSRGAHWSQRGKNILIWTKSLKESLQPREVK